MIGAPVRVRPDKRKVRSELAEGFILSLSKENTEILPAKATSEVRLKFGLNLNLDSPRYTIMES